MEQLGLFELPSPCIGICKVDNRGYCQGCLRSRDERFHWQQYTDSQKLAVIKLCKRRFRYRQQSILKNNKLHTEQKPSNPNASFDFGDTED